jgi:hypothetical protein
MRKFSKVTTILLAAAAVLLVTSAVGSTRAALTYYSENYVAEVEVHNIGVSLIENGDVVAATNYGQVDDNDAKYKGVLLENLLEEGETFVPGKTYKEVLSVGNTGTIDSYVRVILTKSWVDEDGNKDTTLDPALIDLHLTGNGWVEDKEASTKERTVLYYTDVLATGETTPLFADTLSINENISTKVFETRVEKDGYTTITYEYAYDGYTFCVEAEVDAVQTHNATKAIKSAWGVDVTVSEDGRLSL